MPSRPGVNGFAAEAEKTRSVVSAQIAASIVKRLAGVSAKTWTAERVEAEVQTGVDNLRAITPHVRLVFKDVAWDSTRDEEFTAALRRALPMKARDEPWFKAFTAVPIEPS